MQKRPTIHKFHLSFEREKNKSFDVINFCEILKPTDAKSIENVVYTTAAKIGI